MYTVLDIETTGGKYNEEGITEIAIHKFDGHTVTDQFISLINPEKDIQPFVVKLTGITNKMLVSAPKFHEVAKRIIEITEGTTIVAHNAQFDYRILRTEYRRLGYDFERKTICTVDLAQKLLPDAESHSLGKLVRSLGIAVSDRHRANGDALATLKLFKLLLSKDTNKEITKSVLRSESTGELSHRQLDIVEALPSDSGIFYMHNKDGDIIYLSRSNNIKKKVNQIFIKQGKRDRKLQKDCRSVSYEKTGSDLIAQLKEYQELKLNKPYFNQAKAKLYTHAIAFNKELGSIIVQPIFDKQLGVITFNGPETAASFLQKVTQEFGLSPKGNESSKFNALLAKYSLNKRTFILKDKGREIGEQSVILVEKGVYKGYGFCDLNHQMKLSILKNIITPVRGNANTHHIIMAQLRKKGTFKVIELTDATK